jgi:hypothetical protein
MTGGRVVRVVLHPLEISRTEVAPNPQPGVVVWLGPIAGCALPLAGFLMTPRRWVVWRSAARFFAGFCLIANGAYIAGGAYAQVGDCGEMLRTGTPYWAMLAFGAMASATGLYLWHGLGSPREFIKRPSLVTPWMAYAAAAALVTAVAVEFLLSPR